MKLNLGCGQNKIDGFINVDSAPECNPDQVVDLESFPWPFEDNSAGEILLNHVLEHLGADSKTFFGVIKELYRVAKAGAPIRINVPHPRHDSFLGDPTHVRVITPDVLNLFSKRLNREWAENKMANSPLGLYLDVDFETKSTEVALTPRWHEKFISGNLNEEELNEAIADKNNVVEEYRFVLEAVK